MGPTIRKNNGYSGKFLCAPCQIQREWNIFEVRTVLYADGVFVPGILDPTALFGFSTQDIHSTEPHGPNVNIDPFVLAVQLLLFYEPLSVLRDARAHLRSGDVSESMLSAGLQPASCTILDIGVGLEVEGTMLAGSTEICEVDEVQIDEPLWSAFLEWGMVVCMSVRARVEGKGGAKGIMQPIPGKILGTVD